MAFISSVCGNFSSSLTPSFKAFHLVLSTQTFDEGAQLCQDLDLGLPASFLSLGEFNFAVEFIEGKIKISEEDSFEKTVAYIGLKDLEATAVNETDDTTRFQWVDGSGLLDNFGASPHELPWNGGEPNNFGDGEACVRYEFNPQRWNDASCDSIVRILCQTECVISNNQQKESGLDDEKLFGAIVGGAFLALLIAMVGVVMQRERRRKKGERSMLVVSSNIELDFPLERIDPNKRRNSRLSEVPPPSFRMESIARLSMLQQAVSHTLDRYIIRNPPKRNAQKRKGYREEKISDYI